MNTIRTRVLAALAVVASAIAMVATGAPARADVDSITIGSAAVPPGATVGVEIIAAATAPGIGAWIVDVEYDADLLTLKECRPAEGVALCNPDYGDHAVRFVGAAAGGVKGSAVLGGLTFDAGATEGTANLRVSIIQLADPEGSEIELSATDGVITIKAGITPSIPATSTGGPEGVTPGGAASGEAQPSADAAQIEQQSGGVESAGGSGGSNAAAWLLAGAGLATVAGGVWAASRMRKRA